MSIKFISIHTLYYSVMVVYNMPIRLILFLYITFVIHVDGELLDGKRC